MSLPKIDTPEANRILEAAYPGQAVTFIPPIKAGGAFKVIRPTGEVLGAAFNLRDALRQAVQPALKAEAARRIAVDKARTDEFKMFMAFLREKFDDEFSAYVAARVPEADPAPGIPVRTPNDPPRLVPELPVEQPDRSSDP